MNGAVVFHITSNGGAEIDVRRDLGTKRKVALVATTGRALPWPDDLPGDIERSMIDEALARHVTGRATTTDLRLLGRWLYSILVRPGDLVDWAAAGAAAVDLIIQIDTAACGLDCLPWEVLHDGADHLALRTGPELAIARAVGSVDDNGQCLISGRLLVVIGSELTDNSLNPAMEYLGLLEALHRRGSGLNPTLLVAASVEAVAQAISEQRPDVVHIVAHGEEYEGGGAAVALRSRPSPGVDPIDLVSPERLLQALRRPDGHMTPVIVLTACNTAIGRGFGHQPSFASSCVRGGVQLVVGMTGSVGARSARNFTVAFYDALITGQAVVSASAAGRRAVSLAGDDSEVEWSYPSIWLGAGAPTRFAMPTDDGRRRRLNAAQRMVANFRSPRAFCGREAALDAVRRTISPRGFQPVLALARSVKGQPSGASRTLAEIAARLLLDGHLPVVVSTQPGDDTSLDSAGFARLALNSVMTTINDLGYAVPDILWVLGPLESDNANLSVRLRQRLMVDPLAVAEGRAILWALSEALIQAADTIRPAVAGDDGLALSSVVLLVDDLDLRGPVVQPLLRSISIDGFGSVDHRIPVVFTFEKGRGHSQDDLVRTAVESATYIEELPLERFVPTGRAYRQMLIGRPKPLTPAPEFESMLLDVLDEATERGVPGLLGGESVAATINYAVRAKHLLEATEHELLLVMNGGKE